MLKKQNFLQRAFSFSGEMEKGEFWSYIFMRVVGCFCAMIVLCIAIAVIVPGDTEQLITLTNWAAPSLGVLWLLPIIPKTRRRLRSAGHSAKSYLWLLLPVVGWVWFIVLLCGKSVDTKRSAQSYR